MGFQIIIIINSTSAEGGAELRESEETMVAESPRQDRIDIQQAAGDAGHAAKVARMRLEHTGTEAGLPTTAQRGANDMPVSGGRPQGDQHAKPKFRQKKKPTVHTTTKNSGNYRALRKGLGAKHIDSQSWHTTTVQPKPKDPQ